MEIQSFLLNLGYKENVSEEIFKEGPINSIFIDVIVWLNSELVKLCQLESLVTRNTESGDYLGFFVEVSSLLRELCCPYKSLTKGNLTERFVHSVHKKLLITYLCTELQTAKIRILKKPNEKKIPMEIKVDKSNAAKKLKEILICLQLSKPPETITVQQIFGVIQKKLERLSQPSRPKEKVGLLLFTGFLTEKQWFQLECLYEEMYKEYKVRRDLLLTRLDITVKSFVWSEKLKVKFEEIMNLYEKYKSGILSEPLVKISDMLAARPNLAFTEKTSSGAVRKNTISSINSVIIGTVPDRGGRPEEQPAPPPDVPNWQKNDLASRGSVKFSKPPLLVSKGCSRNNSNKNNYGSAPQTFPNSHVLSVGNFSRKDTISRQNKDLRNSFNDTFFTPVYQPVNYSAQLGNSEFGFGGYISAGNNYQEYGTKDGTGHINERSYYQTKTFRGSRSRHSKGRYSYKG